MTAGRLHGRLRTAAWLIGLGLAVEAISLAWPRPTAFLLFLGLGGLLVGVGIVLYLLAIAAARPVEIEAPPASPPAAAV